MNVNCKKLIYRNPGAGKDNVLLGTVEKEDEHLIYFRTRNKLHVVNKSLVLAITETNEPFENETESTKSK